MRNEQWNTLLKAARGERLPKPPVGLIVDTPWIPGFLGISTVDYITIPEIWMKANLAVMARFPDVIFLPGFWAEPGMAAEPSAYGCKVQFSDSQPPSIRPLAEDISAVESIEPANPRQDGLMPMVLSFYRNALPRVREEGMEIRIVAARGPLALASHLIGVTGFLIAMKTEPEKTHKLLKTAAATVKNWLDAQREVTGAEGILVLDDVVGFLSKEDYLEFAHPYLKDIFSMPAAVKIYHNDNEASTCYEFLHDAGVQVFNFTHLHPISEVRQKVGDSVCLLGNVPPRDVLALGTVEQSAAAAKACIQENKGNPRFILSAGGGASPGTKGENLKALISAAAGK